MLTFTPYLALFAAVVAAQDPALATVEWRTGIPKVDNLIEQLTPEEKISLLHGSTSQDNQQQAGYVVAIPRLGIPAVRLSDGEAGVNVVNNATAIPMQLNIGASWSKSAAYSSGYVDGTEGKILGEQIVLAPRVNILRDPVTGNFWQSFSEDPFLNAQLGVSAMTGIQDQGIMGNPKQIGPSSSGASHGAANDVNSIVDMQTLQEVYWSAPGALLEAGAATLMCSYSAVNGVQACEYQPLFDTVRNMYNSTAIVMSDWGATHSTNGSAVAGLDWEMGSGVYFAQPLYNSVYVAKNLSESYINLKLAHILGKYNDFGLLDTPTLPIGQIPEDVKLAHAQIAYDMAVKSGVLLKNNGALPLSSSAKIAVIGPNGVQWSHGTNFAERAYGFTDRQISPLAALQQRTGNANIPSAVGVDQEGTLIPADHLRSLNGTNGLSRNDTAGGHYIDSQVNFSGSSALPANLSFWWQGQIHADTAGLYTISFQRQIPSSAGKVDADYGNIFAIGTLSINGIQDAGGYRLFGDGGARPWSNAVTTQDGWDNIKATVYLEAGWHSIKATILGLLQQPMSVRLCWVTPEQREANIQAAVNVAKSVDTPLVFAFANSPAQIAMTLDDGMDELVSRVAAANPKTVVILQNSEPVTMPWLASIPAVLEMMYPGQESSNAIADLLLGTHNPQGRLPVTYPTALNTSLTRNPAYPGRAATADGNATFSEGVNSGYRWYNYSNTPVLFPFGYGLSYTTFQYSALNVNTASSPPAWGWGHPHAKRFGGWGQGHGASFGGSRSPPGHAGWGQKHGIPLANITWPDCSSPVPPSPNPDSASNDTIFSVSFTLTNTGTISGVEVPQIYIAPPSNAATAYPGVQFAAIALVGFDNVHLAPGKSVTVEIGVPRRQLSFYDVKTGGWVLAKGTREVWVSKSAQDIVLTGTVSM